MNATIEMFLIIEDLELFGRYSGPDPNTGTIGSVGGYGLRLSNRILARNVYSHGFYAGFAVDGQFASGEATANTDHIDTVSLRAEENFYGLYITGNFGMTLDWNFNRALLSSNQRAGIACADDAYIGETTFIDCHFNANPYGFYKEGSTVQPLFFDNVEMVRTKCEGTGNFPIYSVGDATIRQWTGDVELHGVEINGQQTQSTTMGFDNHSYQQYVGAGPFRPR